MPYQVVLDRLARARPRVAAELARPHAEEELLAGLVTDLAAADALPLLGEALGAAGTAERVLLWGADLDGTEDLALASALHAVAPGAGRAAVLELEPDLVVVTDTDLVAVDATVGRPGHLAARARRGEPVPAGRVAAVAAALGVAEDVVAGHLAPARTAAVAAALGRTTGRAPHAVALGAPSGDLLHPDRDDLGAWAAAAAALSAAGVGPALRVVTWLDLARRLEPYAAAAAAVTRVRRHPVLAASRGRLGF